MQQETYSPWRPLRDVRLLLICGILFAATAITGFLNYVSVRDASEESAVRQLAGEVKLTGQNVKNVFLQMERDAEIVSKTPPIQGIVRSSKNGGIDPRDYSSDALWRERLGTILISIMRLRPEYTQMRYIGVADNGREIVRVNRVEDRLERVPADELQEKAEEPYMQRLISEAPEQAYFSPVTLNREHGKVEGEGVPVIRVVIPVYDADADMLFGAIVVNAEYEHLLSKTFSEVQPSHTTYLLSGQGDYLVYEPEADHVGSLQFHKNLSGEPPKAVSMFTSSNDGEFVMTEGENVEYLVRIDVLGDGQTQVGVVMEEPKENLFKLAGEVRLQTIGLSMVLLGAVVAFAWLLIRHYTAPLTDMTNTILQSATARVLPVHRDDEIGALARAFVALTDDLENSEAKSRAVLDTVNDGIITINEVGRIASVNPACEVIFGYTADECLGQNIKMLMPPKYSTDHDQYLANYKRTGKKTIIGFGREVEGMRKNGSIFALDLSVSEMFVEGEKMFTGIVRDISLRKETENKLEEQREFVDLVMDTNPNLVLVLDRYLNIVQANRTFMGAWPQQEGKNPASARLADFFTAGDMEKLALAHERVLAEGYIEETESILFPDGQLRSISYQGVRFENTAGETFALFVGRDQSDLEKITDLLRESNKELDEFAYVASHDLKTPLRVIDNASSWLEEDLDGSLDEDSRENLDLIRSRVARMERLLDDLLEYSRIGRKLALEQEEELAGDELLDDVLHLLARAPETKVTVDPAFSDIKLPKMPLQQIFLNLIGNAIKHGGGDDTHVEVGVADQGDFYRFMVKDNGPGIAKEYHGQIFQMFQTLKPRDVVEGSGMGLAIVRKHIEQRGGRIWLESEEGKGATFYFTWKKDRGGNLRNRSRS